jgi:alpha-tubulin suppressor-like RCC1 family protein
MQSPVGSKTQPVCAGRNDRGQLGTAGHTNSGTFAPVAFGAAAVQDFFKVTAGKSHSCALSNTRRLTSTPGGTDFVGSAYCWGDNTYGQVGQNYDGQWLTPAEVHFP